MKRKYVPVQLVGPKKKAAESRPVEPDPATEPIDYEIELLEWQRIWNSRDIRDFQTYLRKYPNGDFVAHARQAIDRLTQPANAEELLPPPAPAGINRLAAVLNGRGVRDAAPLKIRAGVHRIAILTGDGEVHPWQRQLPPAWRSDVVASTELVAVIYTDYIFLETVSYYGPTISRYRQVLDVDLYEARSGQQIKQESFWADPRQARYQEPYSLTQLVGEVPLAEVLAWLQTDVVTKSNGVRMRAPGDGRGFYYDPNAAKKD